LEYDWRLIADLDEFDELFATLKSADDNGFKDALKAFKTKLNEFETAFDKRKNVLMEVI